MSEFVHASRLYDVGVSERLQFDWAKMQPLAESQAEVERAVRAAEQRQTGAVSLQLRS
ncbi:hypothetical protein ACOZ4F_01680 (plasmid) [Haloarcula marismortui]|uniref:hypothetical protein n=1 Tax=Haloarcula marismortui TaxID=2238 RepID=UPI003C724785